MNAVICAFSPNQRLRGRGRGLAAMRSAERDETVDLTKIAGYFVGKQ
jgi:hypothetical protein